jgi:hypothetical protein
VRATLDFQPDGRDRIREVHELGMVRGPDGRWLIDADERVDSTSPRAAATGLSLDAPVAEATAPTSSASPSPARAEGRPGDDHGDDPRGRGSDDGGPSSEGDPGPGPRSEDSGSHGGADDGGSGHGGGDGGANRDG